MSPKRLVLAAIFVIGIGLRARDVTERVDSTSWRESDVAGIARNYYREGMNISYPRIDWRGDGPGFVEMEFPIFPWAIALLYELFGFNEVWGRLLAFAFSLVGFFVFYKLASWLLSEFASTVALGFFALSPLPIHVAASLQPDGLMFTAYLAAVYFFLRWLEEQTPTFYWLAAAATAAAVLAKAPAAHLLLFFALAALFQIGLAAVRSIQLWLLALMALVPSIHWYRHAYEFWTIYGNSLGLSNEEHSVGLALLTDPQFIVGIVKQEYLFVWMETGILVAATAVFYYPRSKTVRYCGLWLLAIGLLYLVAARTTSALWARYYHLFAVPPAALLYGLGVDALRQFVVRGRHIKILAVAAATMAVAVVAARRSGLIGTLREAGFSPMPISFLWLVGFAVVSLLVLGYVWWRSNSPGAWSTYGSLFIIFAAFAFEIHQVHYIYVGHSSSEIHDCVQDAFAPLIPQGSLIVASGGGCRSPEGYRNAYNASYMFYWLDRKGFNLCIEEQSMEALDDRARRGATHFVAEDWALGHRPEFQAQLERLKQIAFCDSVRLYQLSDTR